MAETEAPEAAEVTDREPERIESIADLAAAVRALQAKLGGGESRREEPEPEADPKAEMRRELARLQAAEKRKQARDAAAKEQADRLAAVEEKVKEKPPREYRRATRIMKWQRPEDER